ncbi:MAG: hypothetical protein U0Y08_05445 [Bacteroidia bacterium]
MDETVTLNHLILYLYNETELTDSVLVQQALDTNEEIADEYQQLMEARKLIDQTLLSPSKDSVNSILAYAQLTAPLQRA